MLKDISQLFWAGVVMALIAVGGLGLVVWACFHFWHADPSKCRCETPCKCAIVKPNDTPANGLHLHRWYRPKANLAWNHGQLLRWQPNKDILQVRRGTPLYCVARHGDVAVLHGAVHGEILVPDGPSSQWFVPAEHAMPGVGELGPVDPPEEKGKPIVMIDPAMRH